jgi:hypothetical protein
VAQGCHRLELLARGCFGWPSQNLSPGPKGYGIGRETLCADTLSRRTSSSRPSIGMPLQKQLRAAAGLLVEGELPTPKPLSTIFARLRERDLPDGGAT